MVGEQFISSGLKQLLSQKVARNFLVKRLDNHLYNTVVENQLEGNLKEVQKKKYQTLTAMMYSAVRNLDRGYISRSVFDRLIDVLVKESLLDSKAKNREDFREKYGEYPPNFLVVSPTQRCNLNCTGCYASSNAYTSPTLPYNIVDRIITEAHDYFHSRFITISGGEPFIYKSQGKTLLDIFEKHSDMFFLVYTNGTFINKEMARKLRELGNVTPAISVEGYEKETDERRGKGVYQKILQGMENLRNEGVPFGVSVTATKNNTDTLLSDEFYEYYFETLGVTYMWQFQLMPIGRSEDTLDLMVEPQQRIELYKKWESIVKERRYLVADFWNSGVVTNGCIAYGRRNGYLYIDWNGNITPCVFVPYYEDNIYDIYNEGKTLVDAQFSDLMVNGRKWQYDYVLNKKKNPNNLLMPCSIRDHYENFRKNILTEKAKPEDKAAQIALEDENYYKTLVNFDKELKKLTQPIWEKDYLKKTEHAEHEYAKKE